ncbi:MAG: energy-coupling factor ABC transporter ATP-binding protein [Nocardioides sp.]|nr:energy-coupling factor ABC transporter ATP-binding protein [Nocardioides sp.]
MSGRRPGSVRVERLSYWYPGAADAALRDIDLTIEPGEFVLLAGASGSGKSTLALALAGLIPNRIPGRLAGQVVVDGRIIAALEPVEAARCAGMVFQNPDDQVLQPVVEAEVAFGPENQGLTADEIRRRVEEALAVTGISGLRRSLTPSLSGGEKQRVAIAATLAMGPSLLLLDEPCSDLDPQGAQQVLGVLRRLNRERGVTVVLIEHRIDEVASWVDRVVLLGAGGVVLDRPVREAFVDTTPWTAEGVAVPEVVRLANALPEVFGTSRTPLSSKEAADHLAGRPEGAALAASATLPVPSPPRSGASGDGRAAFHWSSVDLAFGAKQVLRGLTADVERGSWTALAGPNGSGKTSMAAMAMGLVTPTGGSVETLGRVVRRGRISEQAARVGYLFQSADSMLFSRTVAQELSFGHRWSGAGRDPAEEAELLSVTGLAGVRDRDPFTLSHGQRQRLALAALLSRGAEALLLDEPTTGQDEAHAQAFLSLLGRVRKQAGSTLVMITHDMRAVARHADRLVVILDGTVHLAGPPARVFAHREQLQAAHIVPPPIADLHGRLAGPEARRVALTVDELVRDLVTASPGSMATGATGA